MPAPPKRVHKNDVPLDKRLSWTLTQFAAVNGMSYASVKKMLDEDACVIRWYGGALIPAHKDAADNAWRVLKHQYELAVAAAMAHA